VIVNQSNLLTGGCHCGNLRIAFGFARNPTDLIPRVCDCSFCAKHGASYIFDQEGRLSIEVTRSDMLGEYRQGLEIARFLVCRRCGVLIAALFDEGAISYGALNARCLEEPVEFGLPQAVPSGSLSGEKRRRIWARVWTPGVRVRVSGT
jgi:hypothetical protein